MPAGRNRNHMPALLSSLAAGFIFLTGISPVSGADDEMMSEATESAAFAAVRASVVDVDLPVVQLTRADGQAVTLSKALSDRRPVVLNFIYTSCGSTCPVLSQMIAEFRARLGAARSRVHVVSISIDPEQDTPAVLRRYARRFHAGPGWDYYTGTLSASEAVQKSFGVYRGDKMSHPAVTFLREGGGTRWTRVDGFATPVQLMGYYQRLLAAAPAKST